MDQPDPVTPREGVGAFIVFEGIDGSGKSTQARLLADRIRRTGRTAHVTREPTDGPVGCLIRQALTQRTHIDDRAIAALFVADRIDHLTNERDGLLALVEQGVTVICDRYYLSSYAYHSLDVDVGWLEAANSISTTLLRPSITIFLDIPVRDAVRRISCGRTSREKYEDVDRLQRVREAYEKAIQTAKELDNVVVVPAQGEVGDVSMAVWASVRRFIGSPA